MTANTVQPSKAPRSVGAAQPAASARREPEVRRILGLSVPVTVVLAERKMPIEEVLKLTVGTIIEFDVPFDSELVLHVADGPIGKGQAVKVGENFGLRITHVGPIRDRIDALRGG